MPCRLSQAISKRRPYRARIGSPACGIAQSRSNTQSIIGGLAAPFPNAQAVSSAIDSSRNVQKKRPTMRSGGAEFLFPLLVVKLRNGPRLSGE
jgi:hypothetical protein